MRLCRLKGASGTVSGAGRISAAGFRTSAIRLQVPRDRVACHLYPLHEEDDGEHRRDHDVGPEALIAVPDRQIPETAASDDSRHGGITHKADHRERQPRDEGGQSLRDEDGEEDARLRRARGDRGIEYPAVDFRQGGFDDARHEGAGRDGKRNDRRHCAEARADDEPRKRQHQHHEDDEGEGPQRIDYAIGDFLDDHELAGVLREPVVRYEIERQSRGAAQRGRYGRRSRHHENGLQDGPEEKVEDLTHGLPPPRAVWPFRCGAG